MLLFPLEQAMDEPGQLSGQFLGTCGEADKKDAKKIHGRLNLGGGNSNILEVSPRKLGFHDPYFDEHIFQMGWFNHQLVNLMTPPLVKGSVLHHGIPTFFSVSVHPGWKV